MSALQESYDSRLHQHKQTLLYNYMYELINKNLKKICFCKYLSLG
jgi:hypothetical protein